MTADTLLAAALPKTPSMNRLIVAATIGNVFEWFDFVVYGFFAVTLAEVFWPAIRPYRCWSRSAPSASLMSCGHWARFGGPRRPQERPAAVDRADDDRHDD